jgi:hypothetical protein
MLGVDSASGNWEGLAALFALLVLMLVLRLAWARKR